MYHNNLRMNSQLIISLDMQINRQIISQLQYLLDIKQMQQLDIDQDSFFCSTCQLEINRKFYAAHIRKCRGQVIQEPIVIPNKKPPTTNKIECSICQNTMTLEKFKYHEYFCTEAMIPCEFCNRQIYKFRLDDHKLQCSSYLQNLREQRQSLVNRVKQIFLAAYGVEIEGQLSIDTLLLLVRQVLPALKKMDKGMRSKQIEMIQEKEFQLEQLEFCTICLDNIYKKEIIKELDCKHVFHAKCVNQWLSNMSVCPNCRKDVKKAK